MRRRERSENIKWLGRKKREVRTRRTVIGKEEREKISEVRKFLIIIFYGPDFIILKKLMVKISF